MHFFFQCWSRPVEEIDVFWNVNPEDPDSATIVDFVHFIDATVEKISLYADGEWSIFPKPICNVQKKEPDAPKGAELVKDEFIGFYGEVKDELTQDDIDDLLQLMRIRAELNRDKKE